MTDYEFLMFIERLKTNVEFLQGAAEDLCDDHLNKLELVEDIETTDIIEILSAFKQIGAYTEEIFKTILILEKLL